jgi:hypothetical protein
MPTTVARTTTVRSATALDATSAALDTSRQITRLRACPTAYMTRMQPFALTILGVRSVRLGTRSMKCWPEPRVLLVTLTTLRRCNTVWKSERARGTHGVKCATQNHVDGRGGGNTWLLRGWWYVLVCISK